MGRPGAAHAGAAIRGRFPGLADAAVMPLGEGSDHVAFEVGDRFIFRFARHADGGPGLAVEARLTAWLAPRLPLAVPRYCYVAAEADPPFAGYERLPGAPALQPVPPVIDLRRTGRIIGAFLHSLHASAVEPVAALGVPPDDDPTCEAWSAEALADVRFVCARGHLDARRASRWQQVLALPPATRHLPVRLIHGDFAAEHVLIEDGLPTAVIDWSDAVLGDPARDLAGLLHWAQPDLLHAALEAYPAAEAPLLARARWFAACRAVADIAYGDVRRRPEYVAAGLRALDLLEAQAAG